MDKYKHLLIDLDHTLWDFNRNCKETLHELFHGYDLASKGVNDINIFSEQYLKVNNQLWHEYDLNLITKDELREKRFNLVLDAFNINDALLAETLEENFLEECPKKGHVLPGVFTFLDHVSTSFNLVIITNGFTESQAIKIEYAGLKKYFEYVFTSESSGFKKPDTRFFDHVLNTINAKKEDCIVIGDNPHTDICGANNYSLDSIWINNQNFKKEITCTYYVKDLHQLNTLFTSSS